MLSQNGYAGAYSSQAAIDVIQYYLSSLMTQENNAITDEFSLAD